MSWIEKHESEVFRKHIRDELSRRFSDRNYECTVEEEPCGFWYDRKMYSLNVNFSYLNATLQIRLGSVPEYWDYRNETIHSACDKIAERIGSCCHKFSMHNARSDRSHFSVDFLASHVLEVFGGEK